jgi:hypothetical protein
MKALLANPAYLAAKTFGFLYLGFALYLSFTHQIALFAGWGSEKAWVAPILTDTMMIFGKMLRGHKMADGTRRLGRILQWAGATISLTANVLAGTNPGDRVIGALTIILMLVFEYAVDHTQPVERDVKATKKATTAAAVAKAQATRAANKAAAQLAAADRAAKEEARRERQALQRRVKAAEQAAAKRAAAEAADQTAELNEWAADTTAPVSPAPVSAWTYL